MNYNEIDEKEKLEMLIDIAQKIYKNNFERLSRDGGEIVNVAYSKTNNGENVFEVEIQDKNGTYREYYSQDLEMIMVESNVIKMNIINENRTDLEDIESQEQFKEEIESSSERIDAKKIIEEKNKKIDQAAQELGVDSKELQITEISEEKVEEADEELKFNDKQREIIENNALILDADERINERVTANKAIGGNYTKLLFVQTNGTYNLLGEKEDGTIEKVSNVLDMRPHTANVIGADGEFVPTRMETGFMIKGQNNDVGFGITTAPNGIPKITYMRGVTTDNPIGYNIKDKTSYKKDVDDKLKNIFDERYFDKEDIQDISDGIDRLDDTPEEDRLNVNDFGEDNGIYYDDICAEYGVSYETVKQLDEQLLEDGYINADTRMDIIKNTLEEEQVEEEEKEETEDEKENKIDHGERIIEPIIPPNPLQPRE